MKEAKTVKTVRVVHYINQFFGGIGGEDKADFQPVLRKEPVGPGMALKQMMDEGFELVGTVICGDDYFNNNMEKAGDEVMGLIASCKPDLVIAGPAFTAGRYGLACMEVCRRVQMELEISCFTAMHPENPGAEQRTEAFYVLETSGIARKVAVEIKKMAAFAKKVMGDAPTGSAHLEGYLPRGIRKNVIHDQLAAERAIRGLLLKIAGKPYRNEIPKPNIYEVHPASPIMNLAEAKIALLTEGALFPKGNPDRIESAWATKFGQYDISRFSTMPAGDFHCYHSGVNTDYINEDPNRLVPLDAIKKMESEGIIDSVYPYLQATCGCAMPIANGRKMGQEMAMNLLEAGVDGAIMTST